MDCKGDRKVLDHPDLFQLNQSFVEWWLFLCMQKMVTILYSTFLMMTCLCVFKISRREAQVVTISQLSYLLIAYCVKNNDGGRGIYKITVFADIQPKL